MEKRFTPGPWCLGSSDRPVSELAVCDARGTIARLCNKQGAEYNNAALIAAAPELLRALEALNTELTGIAENCNSITDNAPYWSMEHIRSAGQLLRLEAERLQRIASAAIAKAKGGAQ